MKIYFDPGYNDTDQGFDTLVKARAVADAIVARGLDIALESPRPASRDDLLRAHTSEYVEAVASGEPGHLARSNGIGWDDRLFGAASWSTGGVVAAARQAMSSGGVSGSLSSGLHHARAGHGAGYCTFNGLAIAALDARARGATRVLVLDLDAHCGGGTASIIAGHMGIEQVDVSVSPFDGYADDEQSRLRMANARDYLDVIGEELDRIASPTSISLMLYNAGMDPHERAGGLAGVTDEVIDARERMVFDWARQHHIPTAFVLAGGYTWSTTMDDVVDLHLRTVAAASHASR